MELEPNVGDKNGKDQRHSDRCIHPGRFGHGHEQAAAADVFRNSTGVLIASRASFPADPGGQFDGDTDA